MEAVPTRVSPTVPQEVSSAPSAKKGRKARIPEETSRFFLAKEGSSSQKPELGEEAQTESEALIKAFQQRTGVIYVLTAFRAEAEIQGGNPVLVKRPLTK